MQNQALMDSNNELCQSYEDLEASMERYNEFYNFSPTGFVSLDHTGTIIQINPVCARLLGIEDKQQTGSLLGSFISQQDLAAFNKLLRNVFLLGSKQNCEVLLAGTIQPPTAIYIEATLSNNGQECRCSLIDITKRRQIENELLKYQLNLEQIVTDRTASLVIATEDANIANQAKSQFLSRMSHELRTPLNSVLGFAQLLELDTTFTADQLSCVHEILIAGDHLLSLINEVLDLSRIESGRIELSLTRIELPELIQECCRLIQPLLKVKSIRLNINLPNHPAAVCADRMRLTQVLLNLLSNAIKYNRESGHVLISLEASPNKPDFLRISVIDSGYGIAPEHMTQLFQSFNRLGQEKGSIEGTGLGLAISLGLMELMHGTLDIVSDISVGTTVWLELPSCNS